MTLLTKPIRRESNTITKQGATLMLEIRPGATDVIIVREKGRRKGYAVPVDKIYQLGAHLEAEANRKEKAQKKKDRKAGKI